MSDLTLELQSPDRRYRSGEIVRGRVRWTLLTNPKAIEVQLVWRTEGQGRRDAAAAQRLRWRRPGPSGDREFELTAPPGPWSYRGQLVSILWSVEAFSQDPDAADRAEITLSPTGQPVGWAETANEE